jgi:hypothetical protein
VFEKRLLRRIFGRKWDEIIGGWSKLHNEELHNLHSSPSIIRMIKLRTMRWAGHVARMGENRVMRKIFGPKRDDVIGGWSKLHNEELHNLNSLLNI